MAQPEGNIGGDGKMREQRMVLEDHADMAPRGGDVDAGAGDSPAADADLAALQVFQAGGDAQGGRLAAAGWPEQAEDLARRDAEADVVDGAAAAVIVTDPDEIEALGRASGRERVCQYV